MSDAKISIQDNARLWLQKGLSDTQIKSEMLQLGIEERNIPEMLKEVVKMRRSRNTTNGLVFILIGAMMCLISCVYTLASATPDTGLMLYGLTSLGIVVVFVGLVKIFG
ncbi:MAG: hypothetical protein H6551_04135 [Chitinophagales bacterium]|nr:hypothetical protein [Chitinophagaceae bacterium]MCB9064312.1 hypothetical protein [Chitinophagales bacterium]